LNQIVEKAGITKGALFHHFKGKDDLGLTIIEELLRPSVEKGWLEPLRQTSDPVSEIIAFVRHSMREDKKHLCQGCPLNNLAQEMSPLNEDFRRAINEIYCDWRAGIADAFSRGIKSKTVRKQVSPEKTAAFIVASLAGIIGSAKNAQCMNLLTTAGEGLIDYLESLRA
jgi:AcrR family transcriptional regulator